MENEVLEDVSRETNMSLLRYADLIREWSPAINLVSNTSDLWQRHIMDSAALAKLIDPSSEKTIIDFGSGGGLPGIVLAIILPNPVIMIESDRRKSLFLRTCIQQLGLNNASVVNERIEKIQDLKADYLTARALASLDKLLEYTHKFFHVETICLFPKGRNYAKECEEAKSTWSFEQEIIPSKSGDGVILKIKKIQKKRENDENP